MPSAMSDDEFQVISGIPHHHDSSVLRSPSPDGAATVTRLVAANDEEDGVGDNNNDVTSGNDDLLFSASGTASMPPSVLPKRCRGCTEPILDRFLLQAMDSFWHTACLRCSTCGAVLGDVGATCYTRAGMVLCRNDYIRLFGSTGTCVACRRSIPAGQYVMKVHDNIIYHVDCFRCSDCSVRLVPGDRFALDSGGRGVVCQRDHLQRRQQQLQQHQQMLIRAETHHHGRASGKIQSGLVVLKIIKHCQEEGSGGSELVQGVLLGLVDSSRKCLEVTNCFPFPRHTDEEDFDEVTYQLEMMKNLRYVNVDHLHVGWYQSTNFGTYMNKALVDSQFNYQFSIDESIVLVYDPLRTAKGHLALKALRLTPAMMALYREGDFSQETIKQAGLGFESMFEEVPIIVRNSNLVNALLCEIEEEAPAENKFNFLDLGTNSFLEKNLRLLMDCVDELSQETNKLFNYQRTLAKQTQAKQQQLQKRQQENKMRVERGEQPLPDDDIHKMFKPPVAPARLDSLLLSSQISAYATQMSQFSSQTFGKLFMVDSLQETNAGAAASSSTKSS